MASAATSSSTSAAASAAAARCSADGFSAGTELAAIACAQASAGSTSTPMCRRSIMSAGWTASHSASMMSAISRLADPIGADAGVESEQGHDDLQRYHFKVEV